MRPRRASRRDVSRRAPRRDAFSTRVEARCLRDAHRHARFGFQANQENDCTSHDTCAGLGLGDHSSEENLGAGDMCRSSNCNRGNTLNSYQGLLWGKYMPTTCAGMPDGEQTLAGGKTYCQDGWTLLLKSNGDSTFSWGSSYWTNSNLLNENDNDIFSKFFNSLLNNEAVRSFTNEAHEVAQYDSLLARFERLSVADVRVVSLLNGGQALLFSAGLGTILALCARRVMAGALTIGDAVAIHGMLLQLQARVGILIRQQQRERLRRSGHRA